MSYTAQHIDHSRIRSTRKSNEIIGILLLAGALLSGPSLVAVQLNAGPWMGPLGNAFGRLLHAALGVAGLVLPVILLSGALRTFAAALHGNGTQTNLARPTAASDESVGDTTPRTRQWPASVGLFLVVVFGATTAHLATRPRLLVNSSYGGLVGEYIAEVLCAGLNTVGAWIVASSVLALGVVLSTNLSWVHGAYAMMTAAARWFADVRQRGGGFGARWQRFSARVSQLWKHNSDEDLASANLPNEHDAWPSAAPYHPCPIPSDLEICRDLEPEPQVAVLPIEEPSAARVNSNAPVPFTIVAPTAKKKLALVAQPTATLALPPLSLLEDLEEELIPIDQAMIAQQAERLKKALADYKIFGHVTEAHPGPVVTMFEFVPEPGTRISRVANLANDLAMSLQAQRVRIVAPIPGKGAIGIEVPNAHRETVSFKEIVADAAFSQHKSKLPLALGKDIVGAPVVMDLARMPHLLVAGATGAGKSVSINAMICSLLYKATPDEVRLIMVDPKFLELSGYNDIPHLMLPVVTDPKKANLALRWAVAEMERRYQLLADLGVRDIQSYNKKLAKRMNNAATADDDAADAESGEPELSEAESASLEAARADHVTSATATPPKPLPYIVVIIDEFADLMMVASKEVETSVARLAQKARAAGVHLILATQRPSVDVITGLIKANFPSRMAFQVASNHDSKTILGTYGAENLLGAGDMLVLDRGADMKRIHGAFLSDEEIERTVAWLKTQGKPIYDMDIIKEPEDEEGEELSPEDHDPVYDQAVAVVAESQQASVSMIQRRFRIGYNRAARIVERMEREGVVGPADGVRGREVYVGVHA